MAKKIRASVYLCHVALIMVLRKALGLVGLAGVPSIVALWALARGSPYFSSPQAGACCHTGCGRWYLAPRADAFAALPMGYDIQRHLVRRTRGETFRPSDVASALAASAL